uniref:30S ribosomal protein S9, chloroplastic n=1 Tax=Corethron hystrix TaxID=216773 RepID=A0A7S1BT09_9STRA
MSSPSPIFSFLCPPMCHAVVRHVSRKSAGGKDDKDVQEKHPSSLGRVFPVNYNAEYDSNELSSLTEKNPRKDDVEGDNIGEKYNDDSSSSDSDSNSDSDSDSEDENQDGLDWEIQMCRNKMSEHQTTILSKNTGALPLLRYRELDYRSRAAGLGKRKDAVASVFLLPEGVGNITVNRREFVDYFPRDSARIDVLYPLVVTQNCGKFDVIAHVRGGGTSGQAGAVRHGIARALQNWDPSLRATLKAEGLLTRDPRVVERKKPGKKKARKSFQWVKR